MNLVSLGSGAFAIGPRPRGGDWLESDLAALRELGFRIVVSLLTAGEARELELQDEPEVCQDLGLEFWTFPIVDMMVPADPAAFTQFTERLFEGISQGRQAYCHCRAGLGRAPLLGCSLLVRGGMTPEDSWGLLSAKRGHRVPETRQQREWVGSHRALDQQQARRPQGLDWDVLSEC